MQGKLDLATATCENGGVLPPPLNDDSSDDSSDGEVLPWVWQLVLVILAGVASLLVLLWAYRYWGGDAKCMRLTLTAPFIIVTSSSACSAAKEEESPPCQPDLVIVEDSQPVENNELATESPKIVESLWDRWKCSQALVFDRRMPLVVRIAIPTLICGTIALFIDSNMSPDAVSVMLEIDIGEKTLSPGSIFDFGLGNTVQEMWEAEVRRFNGANSLII